MYVITGIDFSKIFGGQNKILGRKMVKSDKCMGVSQLLGARAGLPPKVYAYVCNTELSKPILKNLWHLDFVKKKPIQLEN